ncbi:MAG: hypothetical protein NTX88_04950 [Candidatus Atribacteria bacterium]|nr:hypothetical protein [Candidatus Atribacteria bacterium]
MGGKRDVHGHLQMIKEPITGFGFGSAPADRGDVPLRTGKEIPSNGEEPFLEALIPPVCSPGRKNERWGLAPPPHYTTKGEAKKVMVPGTKLLSSAPQPSVPFFVKVGKFGW